MALDVLAIGVMKKDPNLRGGASNSWNGLFGSSMISVSGQVESASGSGAVASPYIGNAGSGLLGFGDRVGDVGEGKAGERD